MRWVWRVACMGEINSYKMLVRVDKKRPLARSRLCGEDNIKMDYTEIIWWIKLAWCHA